MTITRKPLARPGTKTAKAIALINAGKTRQEVVQELGLKNDFTYYAALRKIRQRRKEYYSNRQPETSANPPAPNGSGKGMTYELHIIDPQGNRAKFSTSSTEGLKAMITMMSGLGEQ